MLRSLVGSEMCIRDSLMKTSEVCGTSEAWGARLRFPNVNDLAAQAFQGVCLLYTSDAADDLLCVGLGGRRIIKKKTNKQKQNHYETQKSYITYT